MSQQSEVIKTCVDMILKQNKKHLFVAITGESGSGKSHFTKKICEELDRRGKAYSFVNHDDFLIPRKDRNKLREEFYTTGEFNGKTYWEILENWYYLDNFKQLLNNLRDNKEARYFPYEHSTGETSKEEKIIQSKGIIILENKLFLDLMDIVIELYVERANIIRRKIERDSDVRTPEQTIEMHEKAQGYFWDRCKPKNSDIVIDNNDYNNPIIKSVYLA